MIKVNEKFRGLYDGIMQVRRFGWAFTFMLAAVLTVSAINSKAGKLVEGISVIINPLDDGDMLLSNEEIIKELERSFTKPLDGLFMSDIDMARVESILERHPLVRDADAYVDTEMILHVSIDQREPQLRIITNSGQNYYLDEQGTRMPLSDKYTARVLVATGEIMAWSNDYQERKKHQLKDLYDLSRLLGADEFLNALIEQIYVEKNGELVLAPKVGDQVIYLGKYDKEQSPQRLARLKVFYKKGLPYEGWQKYRAFDLRYARQIVCTKR
jgi:cell division protein FtsQ